MFIGIGRLFMTQERKFVLGEQAQTAMELAVFGAVLIFMVSVIVRQGLNSGYQQNQVLKAVRYAMSLSYKHSEGIEGTCQILGGTECDKGDTSHNVTSVIIVEDRLTANSGKYGPIDRMPLITQANATNTRNLFMPFEADEKWNLPMIDFFIDGQHFPIIAGVLKTVNLDQFQKDGTPNPNVKWDPNCITYHGSQIGCAKLYSIIPNHPKIPEWCPTDPCPGLTANERFDLKRDGGSAEVDPALRTRFSWQWFLVSAYNIDQKSAGNLNSGEGLSVKDNKNLGVDVDNDFKEERVMSVNSDAAGVIHSMEVLDFQDGDIDTTFNKDGDCKPTEPCVEPGLQKDLQMYSFLQDPSFGGGGTFLEIDEGKLYGPGKQFVRTASKKDQVDLIQRVIQLSNDSGRFCFKGLPTPPGDGTNGFEWVPPSYPNPVEACNDCFSQANIDRTCMNVAKKIIFIRSRIQERSGRKWVTDESADRKVNFKR